MILNRLNELQDLVRRGVLDIPHSGTFQVVRIGSSLVLRSIDNTKPNINSLVWDSQRYATEIMETLITHYKDGHSVASDTGVAVGIPSQEVPLWLSFGRQKGHTTAIRNFYRNHPELDIGVVVSSMRLKQLLERDIPRRNVFSLSNPNALRGHRFDLLLLDVSSSDMGTQRWQDSYEVIRYAAKDLVILCGDLHGEMPDHPETVRINIY